MGGKMLESMAGDGHRPLMIRTLRRLRAAGFTIAALTNNFHSTPMVDPKLQAAGDREHAKFVALFDHFIESRVVGLSKPDRRFYEHALRTIGCAPGDAVFLDDIGANLKAARDLGIRTVLVRNDTDRSFHDALRELQDVTGVVLLDGDEAERPPSRL